MGDEEHMRRGRRKTKAGMIKEEERGAAGLSL